MSSSEAQRSPVHQATEDSNAEPTGRRGPASAAPKQEARVGEEGALPGDVRREAEQFKDRPDDAMGVPGNFERGAATAGVVPDTDSDDNTTGGGAFIGGGPGAGDASSGGGAGAGIPGGGTDLRTGGALSGGDVEDDRKKLFPQAADTDRSAGRGDDDTRVKNDPDQSSFGGPLDLNDPKAV